MRAPTPRRSLALQARSSRSLIPGSCSCSASKRRATTRPRPCSATTATSARASRRTRTSSTRSTAASCRRSRAGVTSRCSRRRSKTRWSARRRTFADIDGIAVTCGPGLIGSLVVGVAAAKAYAFALQRAALRRQPPARPRLRAVPRPRRGAALSVPHAARLGRPLAARRGATRRPTCACSAERTTTRPARRSTRPRVCSAFPIRAARRSTRWRRRGDPRAHPFPRHRPAGDSLDLSFSGLKTSVRYFLESDAGQVARSAKTSRRRFRRRSSTC